MRKFVLYENSEYELEKTDVAFFGTFAEMGVQIKNVLGLRISPIQFVSSTNIKVSGIIGNILLDDVNLVILPKFCNTSEDKRTDANQRLHRLYIRTLKCCGDSLNSTIYLSKNIMVEDETTFIDVIARHYLKSLTQALQKSHITTYEEFTEKTQNIRGKILIHKQLAEPITDVKTWCRYKKICDNNLFNQLLHWACEFLYDATSDIGIKRKLSTISERFPERDDLLSKLAVSTMRVPRQFSVFSECLTLAKNLYIGNANRKDKFASGQQINGYIINMERSFENIVCFYTRLAALSLGFSHKSQANILLAYAPGSYGYDFYIKPDDLLISTSRKLVLDAKYKVIAEQIANHNKPSREDFYQMVSSCIAHKSSEAILVYPANDNFTSRHWQLTQTVNGEKIVVYASCIDTDADDKSLIDSLSKIIKTTTFFKGAKNE